jgi:hypothetical protein
MVQQTPTWNAEQPNRCSGACAKRRIPNQAFGTNASTISLQRDGAKHNALTFVAGFTMLF